MDQFTTSIYMYSQLLSSLMTERMLFRSKDYHIFPKYRNLSAQPNSVDPDQTTPRGAVWSGSALFAILITNFLW